MENAAHAAEEILPCALINGEWRPAGVKSFEVRSPMSGEAQGIGCVMITAAGMPEVTSRPKTRRPGIEELRCLASGTQSRLPFSLDRVVGSDARSCSGSSIIAKAAAWRAWASPQIRPA